MARLDPAALERVLARAPMEFSPEAREAPVELALPLPDGGLARFRVVSSPILAPLVAQRFPQMRSYSGQGIDDPGLTMRLAWTPEGLHALVLGKEGGVIVARSGSEDPTLYESSSAGATLNESAPAGPAALTLHASTLAPTEAPSVPSAAPAVSSVGSQLRIIRLAIAATGEYTAEFDQPGDDDAAKKQRAYAQIIAMTNLVNAVYERELAVRLQLVSTTDQVFTDPSCDPYDHDPDNDPETIPNIGVLQQNNQDVLDCNATDPCTGNAVPCLGAANYDVGQVFTLTGHGGNGAGQACTDTKAKGAMGDGNPAYALDVNVVLHETGHQFSAAHTFNVNDPQRVPSSAYEPGGGSTIMSYSGIDTCSNFGRCSTDAQCDFGSCSGGSCTGEPKLSCTADAECVGTCFTPYATQPLVDRYFHAHSFQQIESHLVGCGSQIATGNGEPTVDAGPAHTIPCRTPFALRATGSDPDGDPLSYCWEEFDLGPHSPPETDAVDHQPRPLFRSSCLQATGQTRLFPSLAYILGNANQPPSNDPVTGYFIGEALPTIARTMTFRVTVRDNRAGGGGVASDDTQVFVECGSGPFAVTAPNTPTAWTTGSSQMVTWDVAGTDAAPVSCASVAISLSEDGGQSFPIVLVPSTANDGSEAIIVPQISADHARLKIDCVGNVFFDISDSDFILNAPPELNCPDMTRPTDPGQCSAVVSYDLSVTDDRAGIDVTCTPAASSALPRGVTAVDCVATDAQGATDTCTFSVTVVDEEAPAIGRAAADPSPLWPPNHKMVNVSVAYEATDNCGIPVCELAVASDEPQQGLGNGDPAPDWEVVDDHHVWLRSERSGAGDGRTYTVGITCEDDSSHLTAARIAIDVPHDQAGHANSSSGFNARGTGFDAGAETYQIVVLSTAGFDATRMDPARILVGTTSGRITPLRAFLSDVDCDGLLDVSAVFPVEASRALLQLSSGSPAAFRYETQDGAGYLVEDIFGLGSPIRPASCSRRP